MNYFDRVYRVNLLINLVKEREAFSHIIVLLVGWGIRKN